MQHNNEKNQKPADDGLNQKPYDAVFSSSKSFGSPISSPGPESFKKKESPVVKDPNNSNIYCESVAWQSSIFGSEIYTEEAEKKEKLSGISVEEDEQSGSSVHKSTSSPISSNPFLKKTKANEEADNQSEYSTSSKYSTASKKGISIVSKSQLRKGS
jgi:hypothetical protein